MADSRDPWLAANLSWSVPGLGQFYAGQRRAGLAFLSVEIGLWSAWVGWALLPSFSSTSLFGVAAAQLLLGIVAALVAHRSIDASPTPGAKNPWKSVFWTRFLP